MPDKFFQLMAMYVSYLDIQNDLNYCDYNPNSGIIVGCDCGCGGDTIDWDRAREEYEELTEQLKQQEQSIREYLKEQSNE